ncbi:MFS transporter [Colletotrichum scovillei]|uniref:MFS transporter n=1 Tax=Colletotrichum scovillei TaxID=1209932 RepID=UPI0015C3F3E0|nr:MFS transporter [Colletotrichum scovillei]KAF4773596.1 MFS transporter [Colletotrichum scovillei]
MAEPRESEEGKANVSQMERVLTGGSNGGLEKPVAKIGKVDEFGAHTKTDPQEIALVKKIDCYILPILWIMYFLNFLDRNAMINGKLDSLSRDLKLKGTEYNTCVSILFVRYLCDQIPSNMILNRVRPSWYMAGFMLTWSIISLFTYLAHDYKTMLVCRFFLGITEAPFYPGALYMLSMFYTRKEIATHMAVFYTGNMLASAFSGLIAAGIFAGLDGKQGLAGWQWDGRNRLFIVQGAVSIGAALAAFYFLPDTPLQTRWLSPEQRQMAHQRVFDDTIDRREGGTSVWKGLREACTDWRTWLFCLMVNLHLSANGFKNFLPSVVQTFNYNTTITLVLTCPPYILAGIMSIVVSHSSVRFNERTWHTTVSKLIFCAGFAMAVATLNTTIYFFLMEFQVNNIILGWTSATLGQTDEKKAVAIAMANTFGNLASVYTPYLWPESDEPRCLTAILASIGFSLGVVVCAWIMRIALQRQNRKTLASIPDAMNLYVY